MTTLDCAWTSFKEIATKKNLSIQYEEVTDRHYNIFTVDGIITYQCRIAIEDPAGSDQVDFQDNYKEEANNSVGVKTHPFTTSDFDAVFNAVAATCTKNDTTNVDFKVTTDHTYLNGCRAFSENSTKGDWVEMKIVDVDNILGGGAGAVVNQWVYKWYMCPGDVCNLQTVYAGQIPQNCYIRVVYHSIGTENDVNVWINWYLHQTT